jgi:hypothetical protein
MGITFKPNYLESECGRYVVESWTPFEENSINLLLKDRDCPNNSRAIYLKTNKKGVLCIDVSELIVPLLQLFKEYLEIFETV